MKLHLPKSSRISSSMRWASGSKAPRSAVPRPGLKSAASSAHTGTVALNAQLAESRESAPIRRCAGPERPC